MGQKQIHATSPAGMGLVDVIVGTGILALVFVGLATSFQAAAEFAARNRLRANALLLANEHIETIRALPYDSVGTVSGLPPGTIPQLETIEYDGKQYTRRTFIQYVDDPADGTGMGDTLAADYKRVKTELSYNYRGDTLSFALVTTVAPKSQEALTGAGILQIQVKDADDNPLPGATVRVWNDDVSPTVDVTTTSNIYGTVSFPGAMAGDGYNITVDKTNHSSAQTYEATVDNLSPSPGPALVTEGDVIERIFKIDLLADLSVRTVGRPTRQVYTDPLDDQLLLTAVTDAVLAGGALVLSGSPGTYAALGSATSVSYTPLSLGSWLLLTFDDSEPASTEIRYVVYYDNGGTLEPIPELDLPGNTAGFTESPVDLGGLDVSTYGTLAVMAVLTSADPLVTPEVHEYTLSYHEPAPGIPSVGFDLVGNKTIGTAPIVYKYEESHVTDASGLWQDSAMEWDEYDLAVTTAGYQVADACPDIPIDLRPGDTLVQEVTLAPSSAHALALAVRGPLGGAVPRAEVHIVGPGVDEIRTTGACGRVYFGGLSVDTYNVSITAPGLALFTQAYPVDGITDASASLSY